MLGVICGGAVVAIGAAFLTSTGNDDSSAASSARPHSTSASSTASAAPAAPQPFVAPTITATGKAEPIDNEKTDRRTLTEKEVFPTARLGLGGRGFVRDKTQTLTTCSWAARRDLAAALQTCQRVVRATLIDDQHQVAMTVGVAVMPTEQAALMVSQAGDPTDRERWWRGMRGRTAENIDEAAGIPAATTRGRYVLYCFATYFDGQTPATNDPLLTKVAQAALEYAQRPIDRRAGG
ncbi:hypothetical protein [Actinomadura napierensis]|uniref:hypothetical protein n=1 Tax=Actinomadura napierensis TaxID=267854 RepID=UPI0031D0BBAA